MTTRVCVASIRNQQRGVVPPACIQDAALQILRRWAERRGDSITLTQWRVQIYDGPYRNESDLAEADVIVLLSSNEFAHHTTPPLVRTDPWSTAARAKTLATFERHVRGKPIILMTMDREDHARNYRSWHWWGRQIVATLDEADVPLTTQTLRVAHLNPLGRGVRKAFDFGYWGAIKVSRPGSAEVDPRGSVLKDLLVATDLSALTYGLGRIGRVGPGVEIRKWERSQSSLFRSVAAVRATCCFQWPGGGLHLTARYHEAIALGIYPFVWDSTYDVARSVAAEPFQRVRSAEQLADRIRRLRDPSEFRSRFLAVKARWATKRWSDARVESTMIERLENAMALATGEER